MNKNLYLKLYNIMNETEAIKKDMAVGLGQNQYKAISEAAVLNAIKPLLKKYKVVLFPQTVEVTNWKDEFCTKNGDSQRLVTQVIATYKIVDVETGESEVIETVGHGVDTQDKASGKAMTYAYKALLQKTFMMFSGEDTDNQHSDEITASQTKDKKPSEAQLKRLFAIAKSKGVTDDQIKQDLEHLGYTSSKDLTLADYNKLVKGYGG